MAKLNKKKRFNAHIHAETYDKVNDFVNNNELITTRLTPGTILEIGLNLFFKELETKTLETLAIEYLIKENSNRTIKSRDVETIDPIGSGIDA